MIQMIKWKKEIIINFAIYMFLKSQKQRKRKKKKKKKKSQNNFHQRPPVYIKEITV